MSNIEEIIEAELEEKSIEKEHNINVEITDDIVPVDSGLNTKKTKKIRSAAQIAAFEKARKTRAENFEKRKILKKQKDLDVKEEKTKIKETINKLTLDELKNTEINKPAIKLAPKYKQLETQQSYSQPQPIINNYYYNTAPTHEAKAGRKKKVVYVSDTDSDEEPQGKKTSKQLPSNLKIETAPAPAPAPVKAPPQTSTRKLKYNFV